jgi:hypothetical protein
MDQASFDAIKNFYQYGGALALMTDNHFYNQGEANTHCDVSNWAGTGGTQSDAVKFGQMLGVSFGVSSLGGLNPNANQGQQPAAPQSPSHPLAQAWGSLKWDSHWVMISVASAPANAIALPFQSSGILGSLVSPSATYAVLIENPATTTTLAQTALVMTPPYAFHYAAGPDADTGYHALADYFEATTAANLSKISHQTQATSNAGSGSAANGTKLNLVDESTPSTTTTNTTTTASSFNPAAYKAATSSPRAIYDLRLDLNSPQKEVVTVALKALAEQQALTADDLMSFMDHPQYIVRLTANMISRSLPRTDMLSKLLAGLHASNRSPTLTISLARSLAAIGATEAIDDLMQAQSTEADPSAKSEINLAIMDLHKLK